MRPLNFDFEGIADLIQEVGQDIQLCQRVKISAGDRDYGLADDYRLDCRKILAYAVQESYAQIAIGTGNSSTAGGYTCYISAEKVAREEFTETTRIVLLDRIYQVQYTLNHVDRGILRLHQLKLIPVVEAAAIGKSQPDPIYEDYGAV
jgi:hypothetical protein